MITVDLEILLHHFLQKKYNAHIQKETNQLCVLLVVEKREFPLFIRTSKDSDLVQLLTFIPRNVKAEAVPDLARLLHLFNRELDLPGFGMNEETGHVFFRCVIPFTKKKFDAAILDAFINSIEVVCKTFVPPIEAVAEGIITFEDLLEKAREANPENNS